MSTNVLMPALSPTMTEGKLAKWHVKVGDDVKSGDLLVTLDRRPFQNSLAITRADLANARAEARLAVALHCSRGQRDDPGARARIRVLPTQGPGGGEESPGPDPPQGGFGNIVASGKTGRLPGRRPGQE